MAKQPGNGAANGGPKNDGKGEAAPKADEQKATTQAPTTTDAPTPPSDDGKKKAKTKKVPGLRVIAKRDGVRRGGRAWHGATDVAVEAFSEEQLKQLKGERLLIVTEIELEVDA